MSKKLNEGDGGMQDIPEEVKITSPREQALLEYNIARAVNKAIEEAGWMVWGLRNEGKYVLVLTQKEIQTLNSALGGKLTGKKLALRDQLLGALDDEDTTGPIVDAILALVVPFRPEEVEALYSRQHVLLQKQYYPKWEKLTSEEEVEYESLKEELAKLPTARNINEQNMLDNMRWLADRLRHPKPEVTEEGNASTK